MSGPSRRFDSAAGHAVPFNPPSGGDGDVPIDQQDWRDMRRFYLYRHADESGVSGEGLVACGVSFPDPNNQVVLGWLTEINSVAVYDSIDDLLELHGHDGKTEIVFPEEMAAVADDVDGSA